MSDRAYYKHVAPLELGSCVPCIELHNQAAAVDGGITPLFPIEPARPAATEPRRYLYEKAGQ